MKQVLLLTLRLIAKLLVLNLLVGAVTVVYLWGTWGDIQNLPIGQLGLIILQVSIPVLVISIITSQFGLLQVLKLRYVLRILFTLVAFGYLWGVFALWPLFSGGRYPGDTQAAASTGMGIGDSVIHTVDGQPVYLFSNEGRLRYLELDNQSGGSRVRISDASGQDGLYHKYSQDSSRRTDGVVGSVFSLIAEFVEIYITRAQASLLHSVLYAAAFSIFLGSLWALVRLTRWPFFNGVWTFGVVILGGWAGFFMYTDGIQEILLEATSFGGDFGYPALLGFVSLVLLIMPVLMPPFKDWKRQVAQ